MKRERDFSEENVEELEKIEDIEDVEDIEDIEDLDEEIDSEDINEIEKELKKLDESFSQADLDTSKDSSDEQSNEEDSFDKKSENDDEMTPKQKADISKASNVSKYDDIEETEKRPFEDDDDDEENGGMSVIAKVAAVLVLIVIIALLALKGCGSKEEYTVKFNTNGGNSISEQKVKENGTVSTPSTPTRDGYVFMGWYIGDEKYDFNTKVSSNMTIEARWEKAENVKVSGVSLDQNSITLLIGDTTKLVATITPSNAKDKKVTWTSSNPSVATVDKDGNVKAIKAGTAVITVKTNDGNFTATAKVTVTKTAVKVTGVKLAAGKVAVGGTTRLTYTISPKNATNKAVTWKSSDESIAKVNANGVITGVKEGTAKITVTTKDGSFTAEATITVVKAEVTKITISGKSSVDVGKTLQLKANVTATGNASKKVTWTSSNPKIASVSSKGVVTGIANGTVVITATAGGKTAKKTIKVVIPTDKYTITLKAGYVGVDGNEKLDHYKATVTKNGKKYTGYTNIMCGKAFAKPGGTLSAAATNSCKIYDGGKEFSVTAKINK